MARCIMVSSRPFLHPACFCERDISGKLEGNFFNFAKNVHSDSRMNRWSSNVKVSVTSTTFHSLEDSVSGTGGNFFKLGINDHLDSRINWLDFDGQSPSDPSCDP